MKANAFCNLIKVNSLFWKCFIMMINEDVENSSEVHWVTTSSYIEVIMFSFCFSDSNRFYYGQYTSPTSHPPPLFVFDVFNIIWHTIYKKVVVNWF